MILVWNRAILLNIEDSCRQLYHMKTRKNSFSHLIDSPCWHKFNRLPVILASCRNRICFEAMKRDPVLNYIISRSWTLEMDFLAWWQSPQTVRFFITAIGILILCLSTQRHWLIYYSVHTEQSLCPIDRSQAAPLQLLAHSQQAKLWKASHTKINRCV